VPTYLRQLIKLFKRREEVDEGESPLDGGAALSRPPHLPDRLAGGRVRAGQARHHPLAQVVGQAQGARAQGRAWGRL